MSTMSKRQKIVSGALILAISISIFYVGYFYFININSASAQPKELSLDHISLEKISDWKNYRNDKYGFSLNYPNEWASPQEEETKNQESNYIFKMTLGTEDGLKGNSTDGFYVFIYPRDVCLGISSSSDPSGKTHDITDVKNIAEFIANQVKKSDSCVNKRVSVKGDMLAEQAYIYQLAGNDYNYLIIPFIDRNNKSSDQFKAQWVESLKSFILDSPKRTRPNADQASLI